MQSKGWAGPARSVHKSALVHRSRVRPGVSRMASCTRPPEHWQNCDCSSRASVQSWALRGHCVCVVSYLQYEEDIKGRRSGEQQWLAC